MVRSYGIKWNGGIIDWAAVQAIAPGNALEIGCGVVSKGNPLPYHQRPAPHGD
jgi:hypothetical protein